MAESQQADPSAAGGPPARPHGDHVAGRLAALVGGSSCIGMSAVWARWGTRVAGFGSVAVGFWRLTLSLPVVLGWIFSGRAQRRLAAPGQTGVDKFAVFMAVAAGVCFGIDIALYYLAVDLTTAANATLMSNCAPIFVAFVAWYALGERFEKIFIVGLVVTLAGVVVLAFAESITERASEGATHQHSLTGDMLALISAVFYGGYQLCIKRARRSIDTATSMAISTTASSVVLLAGALILRESIIPHLAIGWAIVAGAALGSQILGQCVIVWAMGRLPVSFASVAMLVQPIMAAVFGWLLLGETLGWLHGAGAAAVLGGIYLAKTGSGNNVGPPARARA